MDLNKLHRLPEISNKKIAIWGLGNNFKKKEKFIYDYIKPDLYVDINESIWGTEIKEGVICQSPTALNDSYDVVIITPEALLTIYKIKEMLPPQLEWYSLNYLYEKVQIMAQSNIEFNNKKDTIMHFSCDLGSCVCNLNCSYCYVDFWDPALKFNSHFYHSVEFMVKALSRKRLGARAFFNIVGQGETLLKKQFVDLAKGLLAEGHFLMVTTNGTVTEKIREILDFSDEAVERTTFHFSLHYNELKKKGMLDVFFSNYKLIRQRGGNVIVTFPGSDEYLPFIDEIRELCLKNTGVEPVVSVIQKEFEKGLGFPLGSKLSKEVYFDKWRIFGSKSQSLREMTYEKIHEVCYAGIRSGWINLNTGELRSCSPGEPLDNIYDDITREIKFKDEAHMCPYEFCKLNNLFLSGRIIGGKKLPTMYEVYCAKDENGQCTFNDEMREALDYVCEY